MTAGTRVSAVTGASGFLGEALVNRLLADGGVRALFRQPSERSNTWKQRGCEVVIGDLDNGQALQALVDGAEVVHHCAATLAKTDPSLSHRVNVGRLNNYSRTKYEGELVVQKLGREQGLRHTIIRPTNTYGLRSGPWFRQWERVLRLVSLAFGDIPIDLVYVEDVVEAMVAAASSQAAEHEAFNVGHETGETSCSRRHPGRSDSPFASTVSSTT